MLTHEIITEAATDKVFHYTSIPSALSILQSKQFRLSPSGGTPVEQEKQDGRQYYLSLARSPSANYTVSSAYDKGVVFNMNGRWLNTKYRTRPVDYWDRMWWNHHEGKRAGDSTSEQEDRIQSDKPYLPLPENITDLITEIHVLCSQKVLKDWPMAGPAVRKIAIAAKTNGIPFFLYESKKDWLIQNKTKTVPLSSLMSQLGGIMPKPYVSRYESRDDFKKWREMYYATSRNQLSKEASDEVYNLLSYSDRGRALDNDIHNGKRDNNESLHKLLAIFKKLGIHSGSEYADKMKEKWRGIYYPPRKENTL